MEKKSKKIILFIVEGHNDKIELDAIVHSPYFEEYLDNYIIDFIVVNNDITADLKSKSSNIKRLLNDIFMDYKRKHTMFKMSDYHEIVQVVDTDGTFIPMECIEEDEENLARFKYEDNLICTYNFELVYARNNKKSSILNTLVNDVNQICGIPYSVYYVSCNMDHLLFNERNSTKNNKRNNAFEFALKCKKHPEILKDSLFSDEYAAKNAYYESWEDIQYKVNSLQRKTNLNLFFSDKAKNQK